MIFCTCARRTGVSSIGASSCAKVSGNRSPKLSQHRASLRRSLSLKLWRHFCRKRTEEQEATPKKLAKTSPSGDSLKKAVADANRMKALYLKVQGQEETLKSTMNPTPSCAWSTREASTDMHTAIASPAAAVADGFGAKILTTDVSNVVASDSFGGFSAPRQFAVLWSRSSRRCAQRSGS